MPDDDKALGDSSLSFRTIFRSVAGVVLLGGIVLFVLQNSNDVEVNFLTFSGEPPLYFVIIVSMILGILAFGVIRIIWRRRRSSE